MGREFDPPSVRRLVSYGGVWWVKKLSNRAERLLSAVKKGYKITTDGEVIGVRGKIRCLTKDHHGYLVFSVGGYGGVRVHRFQAYQKFGNAIFEDGVVVRHLDGDLLNNHWDNIAIGTMSDNMMDIPEGKRLEHAINATRAHMRSDWSRIDADRVSGMTYDALSEKYGVSKGALSYHFNKSILK